MDALAIGGGIGRGITDHLKRRQEQERADRDNAIKDYQIKKLAEEEKAGNRWIPMDLVFPQAKMMPETMKFIKDSIGASGFGNGYKEINGLGFIRAKEAKQFMEFMMTHIEFQNKLTEFSQKDLINQYTQLTLMKEQGIGPDNKKLKPEELELLDKKIAAVGKAIGGTLTIQNLAKERLEAIKGQKETNKLGMQREVIGKGPDGRLVFSSKLGGLFYEDNSPYTGDPSKVELKGEVVRSTPTTSTVIRVGGDSRDNRTSNRKDYEYAVEHDGFKGSFMDFMGQKANLKKSTKNEEESDMIPGVTLKTIH